jgi:hypothetical protein
MLHAPVELLVVALDVLIDSALNKLGLPDPSHQRGITNLLLGALVDLDWGLGLGHRYFGTRYQMGMLNAEGRG